MEFIDKLNTFYVKKLNCIPAELSDKIKLHTKILKQIENTNKKITELLTSKNETELEIAALKNFKPQKVDYVNDSKIFQRLIESKKYIKFYFDKKNKNVIHGITNDIIIKTNKSRYLFGKYNVTINANTNRVAVDSCNPGKFLEDQHIHPHISFDKHFCFGNLEVDVIMRLKTKKYGVIYDLVYSLLCSYSRENPYESLSYYKNLKMRRK